MYFLKPPTRLLLLAGAALITVPVFSQIKKGFKYLDKEKWDRAAAAFAPDTANAELSAVAFFGLAQVYAGPDNPGKDYRAAMRFQGKAVADWKALKNSQRTALTKDYKVTLGAIEKVRTSATNAAWATAGKTTSLREIDDFIDIFPNCPGYMKSKAVKKQSELFESSFRDGRSYEELSYLYGKHRDDLRAKYPGSFEDLEQRVFEAFIAEKGIDQLAVFFRENPAHPLVNDPGKDEFSKIWNNTAPVPAIRFLAAYPQSRFGPYVRKKAVAQLKTAPLSATDKATFSDTENAVANDLEWEASGKTIDLYAPFRPSDREDWMTYIRHTAPSPGAFTAIDKMYRFYADKRDWQTASEILQTGKPLFKNKRQWFDDLLAIAQGKATGPGPQNAGPAINTDGSEFSPVISVDGKELFFCGRYRDDNLEGEDIFVTHKTDSGWAKPALVKELSFAGHQAPGSLTADGNRMLMFNNGRLFQTDRTPTGWSTPTPVPVDISAFPWVGLCQISSNNQVLMLEAKTVNYDPSHRESDIYISLKDESGNWGKPVKLDSVINTGESERTPFLHPDLRTMYFSSAGHPGVGGLDVFKTTRLDDTWLHWSHPVNLGKEVNTPTDDWGYKIEANGLLAWFAIRSDETKLDIYSILLPDSMRPESVKIIELSLKDDDGKPFDGKIIVQEPATGIIVGTFQPNPSGGVTTLTVPNDKAYVMKLEKNDYFPTTVPLPVQEPGKPLTMNVALKPVSLKKMESGETAILNLLFDYDKDEIRSESLSELQAVASVALKNNYKLLLLGYTDNAGSPEYNKDLSRRRADAVKRSLTALNVPDSRIAVAGFGEEKPIADNATEEGRAQNRRVEIKFEK